MQDLLAALPDALQTSLPYMAAFLGVWLMFRVYHDFDLTVGGSFTLGGAITAIGISQFHIAPWAMVPLASIGGGLAGLCTYVLHRVLRLRVILASIIVNTALASIDLVVMGLPDVSIVGQTTIASPLQRVGVEEPLASTLVFGGLTLIVFALVALFLSSQLGLGFRAAGANPRLARAAGVSPEFTLALALTMANILCGLSGSLLVNSQGFADVNMGTSVLIFGITAVLIGGLLVRSTGIASGLTTVVVGSFAYEYILSVSFRLGVPPQWFSALTAAIVAAALAVNVGIGSESRAGRRLATLLRAVARRLTMRR
jgi:putative ABC transport system permease protein